RAVDDRRVRRSGEGAGGIPGDGQDGRGDRLQRAEQAEQFLALAAVREEQGDVFGGDHAQVAVHGRRHVEDVGPGAGRVQRRGDLAADVRRLADAGDGDAAAA